MNATVDAVDMIEKIKGHAERISNGLERVSPGMELSFTQACTPDDCIWQGDLGLIISSRSTPPEGFTKDTKNTKQLVPGTNIGSRHCLESLDGVTVYLPENWNEDSLVGPFIMVDANTTARILHPVHGVVNIPGPFNVECIYQKEYDKEQEKERRARD
jgi:hypothetical protein